MEINKPSARTRRQLEALRAELAAARAEVNSLRRIIYQAPGDNARTLITAADIDSLLADVRRTMVSRLEKVGIIPNATLILQHDII
ncbi:MAG: hypothetical protein NC403_09165 [Muribaculaceae bacterium]|nr:hypothetical protein [Muribaculaceae bacterium]